jgi:hypothetical protein
MNPDVITTDLKQVLKRLKLGPILDTLPERLASPGSRRCHTRTSCC